MQKHSIVLYGHSTSFSLEEEFWQILKDLAKKENKSIASLIEKIDANRTRNLSSALRIFILNEILKDK